MNPQQSKMLRVRGARRSDREIDSDPGIDGDLTLHKCNGQRELKLCATDDARKESIIPVLFDAQLVTMHGNGMLFQRLERTGEITGTQHFQEW